MALLLNVGDTVSRSYSYTQPSPLHPIQPNETGDLTGNLFDKTATNVNNGYITNGFLKSDGTISENVDYRTSEYIRISQEQVYMLHYGSNLNLPSVCFYDSSKNYISGVNYAGRWDVRFTTPKNAEYLRFSFRRSDSSVIMLNLGSTALPYEPYGYKIPILSNSQTTNAYLGEVQSTRRIKKRELKGNENWIMASNGVFYADGITDYLHDDYTCFCTHFATCPNQSGTSSVPSDSLCFGSGTLNRIFLNHSAFASAQEVISYLSQQYAAGTPVCVWYVLAEPTTSIVNEPLRKIGGYADEVSGITIPVIAGANTISVDTTVQPSEVTVNYKGWHPVQSVHEAENGQWD